MCGDVSPRLLPPVAEPNPAGERKHELVIGASFCRCACLCIRGQGTQPWADGQGPEVLTPTPRPGPTRPTTLEVKRGPGPCSGQRDRSGHGTVTSAGSVGAGVQFASRGDGGRAGMAPPCDHSVPPANIHARHRAPVRSHFCWAQLLSSLGIHRPSRLLLATWP